MLDDFAPSDFCDDVKYLATPDDFSVDGDARLWVDGRIRPSIHMPRWASRLTLTVTDVRVERVQDISEADARAEGTECRSDLGWDYAFDEPGDPYENAVKHGHRAAFRDLWDSINAARGYSWDSNPWVWAVAFEVDE